MKLLLLVFSLIMSNGIQAVSVATGEQAPHFKLKGHDGKDYSLSDLKGKHVVLEWTNKDCPYVKKHYKTNNMQDLQKTFTEKEVVWLSVISSAPGKQGHLNPQEAAKNVSQTQANPTAVLFDETGKVGKMYDAKTTPHMYIINPEGQIVYQGAIDDNPSASPKAVAKAKPLFANALKKTLNGEKLSTKEGTTDPYGCSVKY